MNERKRGDGKRADKQIETNVKGGSFWIAVIS
jgi:hypothetical protein